MSDTPPPVPLQPPPIPPGLRPPEQRSGCATAFMVVVGIVLLLPGLCAVIIGAASLSGASFPSDVVSFILYGLLAGFSGVMLIREATRGRRS